MTAILTCTSRCFSTPPLPPRPQSVAHEPQSLPTPSGGGTTHPPPQPPRGGGAAVPYRTRLPLAWEITPGGTLHRGSDRTIECAGRMALTEPTPLVRSDRRSHARWWTATEEHAPVLQASRYVRGWQALGIRSTLDVLPNRPFNRIGLLRCFVRHTQGRGGIA